MNNELDSASTQQAVTDVVMTRLTSTSRFGSKEELDAMLGMGMEAGANESWDRLADYLAADPS